MLGKCLVRIAVLLGVCGGLAEAQDKPRRALLILNTDYRHVAPLPAMDAAWEHLREALRFAKFEITEKRNLTQQQIAREVEPAFLATLKPGDTLLFFYSGYAIQANGDNFLVPVDFDPKSTDPVAFRARSLTGFQQMLDEKEAGLKMIVLDAAAQSTELLGKASGTGLALPDFTDMREIAFSFSSGLNAVPMPLSPTERSLFLERLSHWIRQPGTSLVDAFTGAQREVASGTSNKLNPFFQQQTTQAFLFSPPPPPPPPKVIQAKPVDTFTARDRVNSKDRLEYVYLRAGKFQMGCVPEDTKCEKEEKPRHEVTLTKNIWMGVTEVTVEAYRRFLDMTNPKEKLPRAPIEYDNWRVTNLPMVMIKWEEADAFCKWGGGRLPTEAEWEYAARGGKADQVLPMSMDEAREKANFHGKRGNDRFDYSAPVKQFDPNPFGLYDMFGNVWEYVSDFYDSNAYTEAAVKDPKGPATGKEHVIRGGSWDSDPEKHLRISFRRPGTGGNITGFRCVLEDSPQLREQLR